MSYPSIVYFIYLLLLLVVMYIPATLSGTQSIQNLDSITAAARAFLLGTVQSSSVLSPVTVDALDPRLRLAACDVPLEVAFAPGARSTGRTIVMVRCPSPRPWSLYVPAKVTTSVFVVVATHPLQRDQVVTAADVTVEQRDAGDLPAGYLTDPNQILGKILARPLTAGAVLIPGQTRIAVVIRRGDRVSIVVQGVGLAVRSTGIALADAGVGERLSVRNENSRRIVEGIVEKAGVVIMDW